jgi:FG-GAP repeat
LLTAPALGVFQQAELTVSGAAVADLLGCAVAVSGDTMVVGAVQQARAGAAYVFVRNAGVWTQQAKLAASDGNANDEFGSTVAISGDTILVGAYGHTGGGNVGAAYVFTRSGVTWTPQQKLTPLDGASGDWFGCSVGVSGNTAVIGAYGHAVSGKGNPGAAYVFTRSGTTWTQAAELWGQDGADNDWFGYAVAISGNTAVVGAWHKPNGAVLAAGAAYIFAGSSWTEQQELALPSPVQSDEFGLSVAISGDTALVGAQGRDLPSKPNVGQAFVYVRSGAVWAQQAALSAADGASGDGFGYSVALDGDSALVGAPYRAVGTQSAAGTAYAFTRSAGAWTQGAEPTAADGAAGDELGAAVGLSGATAVVGAPERTAGGVDRAGTVYVFLDETPPVTIVSGVPAGWSKTPVTVTLTSTDDLSGVTSTEYRLQGAPAWTTYSAPFQVTAQGSFTYECRSTDKAGNVETPKSFTVRIDTSAPTTTVSGIPAGWSRTPVRVTLTGSDSLSGRASTEYRLQGAAAWTTYAAPFAVSVQGASVWEFRSTDAVGNVEATKTFTVRIDTQGPQTLALAKLSVKKGKKATFRFKVSDLTPTATVTIKIYKHTKLKKTITVGSVATNSTQSYKWKCKLAKGSYTWKVYAKDLAGNGQSSVGSKKLTVK